jgi:transcriptional regulator with XRE-family HTH domain
MTDLKRQQSPKNPNDLLRRARTSRGWTQTELAEMLDTDTRTVGRWENDGVLPNVLSLQKLCDTFGMTEIELGFISPEEYVPPYCYIPHRRNPCFTGRERILQTLYDALEADRKRGLPLAISGVGGIGKTQLLIEYSHKYGYRYQAIFYLRAESRSKLAADMATIAGILDLPQRQEQDLRVVVAAVQQWLNTHAHWLLIYDNVTDLDMLSAFIPRPEKGHIALTTLSQLMGSHAHKINLERMDQQINRT